MVTEIKKNWFRRHWAISIFLGLFILGILGIISEKDSSGITSNVVLNSEEENIVKLDSLEKNEKEDSDKDYPKLSSLSKIFLQSKDFPTEYKYGEEKQVTSDHPAIKSRNAEKGFIKGRQLEFTKYELTSYSIKDLFDITVRLYEFNDTYYSSQFKDIVQNSVEESGGYKEVKISTDAKCFAWIEDYGYETKFGSAICYNKNIVYWISVGLTNSFKQPKDELIKFVDIVDEKIE